MIGERIGDYEVIGSLGRGGFGAVYKAVSSNGVEVALKLLNPQALDNQRVVKKFFHEAMILAKLDHPNITNLLEFFPDGNNYALVMEFVEGVELKSVIQKHKGPMPFVLAYRIAIQALDAFEYAHQNGILHRDIKPGNIIIDKNGNAKIMDFGIAKMSSAASHDTASSMLSVHYVPPERFDKTKEVDQRSDIYSLGLVLYEMFAGRRPFTATETAQVMFCQMNQVPDPPTKFSPALPDNISNAIIKALEKNPTDRFNSFTEFKAAIQLEQEEYDDASAILDSEMTLIDQLPSMEEVTREKEGLRKRKQSEKILNFSRIRYFFWPLKVLIKFTGRLIRDFFIRIIDQTEKLFFPPKEPPILTKKNVEKTILFENYTAPSEDDTIDFTIFSDETAPTSFYSDLNLSKTLLPKGSKEKFEVVRDKLNSYQKRLKSESNNLNFKANKMRIFRNAIFKIITLLTLLIPISLLYKYLILGYFCTFISLVLYLFFILIRQKESAYIKFSDKAIKKSNFCYLCIHTMQSIENHRNAAERLKRQTKFVNSFIMKSGSKETQRV